MARRNQTPDGQPDHDNADEIRHQQGKAAEGGEQAMDQGNRAAQAAGEAGRQGMDQATQASQRGIKEMRRIIEQANVGSSDSMDLAMRSGASVARSMQEMTMHMMQFAQEQMRRSMRAAGDMMECRSFEDMMSLQQSYMRDQVDGLLHEGAHLLKMSTDMARQVVAPISDTMERTQTTIEQENQRLRQGGPFRPNA